MAKCYGVIEVSMAWAELSDVRCYYELLGQGDAVLLIPGLGTTCRVWDPIAPELSEHFSLILPDNRGIGRSESRRAADTLAHLASDLVELLDYLQVDTAHVIGISFGGVIAQQFAVDHSSRVRRLVLISTSNRFGPYLTGMATLLGQTLYRFPRQMYQQTFELLGNAPGYFDEHQEDIQSKIAAAGKSKIDRRAMVGQLRALATSEIPRAQYRIKAPTLILSGEYDSIIPHYYAKRMAEEIPESEFVIIPGCGHNPASEAPQTVAPMIADFLGGKRGVGVELDRYLHPVSGEVPRQ